MFSFSRLLALAILPIAYIQAAAPIAPPAAVVPWSADRGDGTYRNPILFADYSDPDVFRVGEDYYLVSSSFNCVPGIPILHSKDLINWEIIGHALTRLVPESVFATPQHGKGVWAPALRYHDSKFYIYYPDPDFGIYVVTAKNAAGPWTPPVLVKEGKGLIDPCPLWDGDGKAYLVHGWARSRSGVNNRLTLLEMSPDGMKTMGEDKIIIDGSKLPNYTTLEGPKFYKRNGYYYIFAPAGGVKNGWQSVFRSKTILGPYEDRIVLDQGDTTINGPHQGAWGDTVTKESWFIHFQDRGAYGRVVHLQPMKWTDDWPLMGEESGTPGKGKPVLSFKKPNINGKTFPIINPQTSDEFNGTALGLQWQWQANPGDNWMSQAKGYLTLYSQPYANVENLHDLPNLLLQKFPGPEFMATVAFQFHPKIVGEKMGLVIMGPRYAWIGLTSVPGGGFLLSQNVNMKAGSNGLETTKAGVAMSAPEMKVGQAIAAPDIFLRVTVREGAKCEFSYSTDNITYQTLGEMFEAQPEQWIGAKIGLFAVAPSPTKGYVDFDWFRVSKVSN